MENNKNKKVIFIRIIFVIIIIAELMVGFKLLISNANKKDKNDLDEHYILSSKNANLEDVDNNKVQTIDTETTPPVTNTKSFNIEADKVVTATGFTGSSNMKFYIKSGNLYYINIGNEESKSELLATGVIDLYIEGQNIMAVVNSNYTMQKASNYVTYIITEKVVTATGFAGSSNMKFYIKSGNLYYINIGNEKSKSELLATGIIDLYVEGQNIMAVVNSNYNIQNESKYITYIVK